MRPLNPLHPLTGGPGGRCLRAPVALALLALLCAAPFGHAFKIPFFSGNDSTVSPQNVLRADLTDLFVEINALLTELERAGEQLDIDRSNREEFLRWKQLIVDRYAAAHGDKDPKKAFARSWLLTIQLKNYFSDDAKRLAAFGEMKRLVLDAFDEIERLHVVIAYAYFPLDRQDEIRKGIETQARETPLKTQANAAGVVVAIEDSLGALTDMGLSAMRNILSVPMLPTRAFGAIRQGSEDFHRLSVSLEGIKGSVDRLPTNTRLELEAMLDHVLERETSVTAVLSETREALIAFQRSVEASNQLTSEIQSALTTSERPLHLATDLTTAVAAAMVESRLLTRDIRDLLATLEASTARESATTDTTRSHPFLISEYEDAARAIEDGAAQVTDLLAIIDGWVQGDDAGETTGPVEPSEGRPYDIRDYEATARAIDGAAARIVEGLGELRVMLASEDIARNQGPLLALMNGSVTEAALRAEAIVNLAARRLMQLLGLGFFLVCLLIILWTATARFRSPRRG